MAEIATYRVICDRCFIDSGELKNSSELSSGWTQINRVLIDNGSKGLSHDLCPASASEHTKWFIPLRKD